MTENQNNKLWESLWKSPLPKYEQGDTTAATARLAEIRRFERGLRVPRELLSDPEIVEARWRSKHPDECTPSFEILPYQPALPAKRPPEDRLPPLKRSCCFPFGDAPPYKFCSAPRVPGKPYCASHLSLTTARKRPNG